MSGSRSSTSPSMTRATWTPRELKISIVKDTSSDSKSDARAGMLHGRWLVTYAGLRLTQIAELINGANSRDRFA